VNEAFALLGAQGETADVVVGVQGDEPEIPHADLRHLVAAFEDGAVEMATLAAPIQDDAEGAAQLASASVVKVVCDARGDALYFSRAPIPARGHDAGRFVGGTGSTQPQTAGTGTGSSGPPAARRHVGVYAFTPRALERFCALPRGALEVRESLEQLRWLEHGGKLRVVDAARAPQGIDTRADYDAFVLRASARTRGAGVPGKVGGPGSVAGASREGRGTESRAGAG
jgi:3-deoxy-manno-octulosonate cytidylyltransferase (CMP-KDO synthetase)